MPLLYHEQPVHVTTGTIAWGRSFFYCCIKFYRPFFIQAKWLPLRPKSRVMPALAKVALYQL